MEPKEKVSLKQAAKMYPKPQGRIEENKRCGSNAGLGWAELSCILEFTELTDSFGATSSPLNPTCSKQRAPRSGADPAHGTAAT